MRHGDPGTSHPARRQADERLASIAEATGASGAGLAGAIIRFFGMLWPNPRQMVLRVWVEPVREADPDSPASAVKVTVDLDEPQTGATISTKTVAGKDINEAASMVAGDVARQMFAMDRATPRWWHDAADGRDLGAMLLARLERVHVEADADVETARRERIRRLWQAGYASRAAAVVRYELAQLLELSSDDLAALRLHAMNREEHPRFYRGRYRLAMSLQMIANPQHERFSADTEQVLNEVFQILRRCGVTRQTRCRPDDVRDSGDGVHRVLSPSLRMELLNIAASELSDIRWQLTLPFVLWSTLAHHNERAVWVPHWWPPRRQAFHDGVCVAELLVAVRQALIGRERREPGERPAPEPHLRLRHLLLASRIAAAITGSCSFVRWIRAKSGAAGPSAGETASPSVRDRIRWLPGLRRSASWQAAYNTACLYAALAGVAEAGDDERLAYESRVIVSLERAIGNRYSEMERSHDWISRDPDFTVLRTQEAFRRFREWVSAQKQRDYPAPFGQDTTPAKTDGEQPVAGDPLARDIVPLQG